MRQNAQISMLQFKIFPGAMPLNPHVAKGIQSPPKPRPSALRRGAARLRASRGWSHSMFISRWCHCLW